MSEEAMERGAWGGKFEFILTCIGAAVGLGNVWRFPYLLFRSGGGAFLIPFVIMLFLIGIPIFHLEITWGQFASLGPLAIFKSSPIYKGIGFSMIFTNIIVALYYNVIICWCIYYFFASLTNQLPWEFCGNPWNTKYCTTAEEFKNNISISNKTFIIRNGTNMSRFDLKTPSEEYFYRKVLQMSTGIDQSGNIVWQLALCLFLAWLLVYLVLIKGIASLGKVVYVTSTFPYLLLTIMLVRGVTLEGASKGIEFYMLPDFSKLSDSKVWSDAATQIFYALSTCTGALIAMSSYNNFKNNTIRDSLIVPISNVLTSVYAGFVIFSVLGYMAVMKGVEVKDVAADGPGLVFVVYPEGLSTMPAAPVWSVLFFIMMMMLGFSSMFGMVECFFVAFMDEFPMLLRRSKERGYLFRGIGTLIFYLISLPMVTNSGFYLFSIVDSFTGGFPLLIIGIFELIVLMYVYGYKNFESDMEMMMGKHRILFMFFRVTWCFLTPLVIMLSIVATGLSYEAPTLFNKTYIYPLWGEVIGWLIVTFCLAFIPLYFVFYMRKDLYDLYKKSIVPDDMWGPAQSENRTGRYEATKDLRSNKKFDDEILTLVINDDLEIKIQNDLPALKKYSKNNSNFNSASIEKENKSSISLVKNLTEKLSGDINNEGNAPRDAKNNKNKIHSRKTSSSSSSNNKAKSDDSSNDSSNNSSNHDYEGIENIAYVSEYHLNFYHPPNDTLEMKF